MSNWNTLSEKLVTVVSGISGTNGSRFPVVQDHPSNDFSAYPAVVILPSNSPSNYSTNTENERHYTFDIFVYLKIDTLDYATAFERMRKYLDEVIDAIEETIDLDGLCKIVDPMPAEWGEATVGGGTFLIGSGVAVCKVHKDIGV